MTDSRESNGSAIERKTTTDATATKPKPASAVSGDVHITHTCDRCRGVLRTTVAENVIDHPAVVSFCYDHGVDATAIPHWKLDEYLTEAGAWVVRDDSLELRTAIRLAGEELTLALDEGMQVRVVD